MTARFELLSNVRDRVRTLLSKVAIWVMVNCDVYFSVLVVRCLFKRQKGTDDAASMYRYKKVLTYISQMALILEPGASSRDVIRRAFAPYTH